MSKSCATCRFWREQDAGHLGPCLRYPPSANETCMGAWPTTHRSNWCGEHQPREAELEKPKAREPGWYWVRRDVGWRPMHWGAGIFNANGFLWREDELLEIGPRLEPPA